MVKTATVFGLFWAVLLIGAGMVFTIGMGTVVDLYGSDPAQAAMVWLAIESVHQGLGGANEIVGGLWVLLISWAALRGGGLPRALNYLGVVIGVGGLLMFVPALGMLGPIFGLGIIGLVIFRWLKSFKLYKYKYIALGMGSSYIAMLVGQLTNCTIWAFQSAVPFWLLVGAINAVFYIVKKPECATLSGNNSN